MDDFDEVVLEFMQDYGFTATYLQGSTGTYNPATGENVQAVTELPVTALQLDLPLTRNGVTTEVNNLIQEGDKQLFIRPRNKVDPLAPQLVVNPSTDNIRIGGVEWTIVASKEINTTGLNQVLIELYIRR